MHFVHQSFLPVAPARVFAFHERQGALQLLTPPWEQTQVLQAATASTPVGTLLRDEIEYEPPLHALGRLVDPVLIRPRLTRLFTDRHQITAREVLAA